MDDVTLTGSVLYSRCVLDLFWVGLGCLSDREMPCFFEKVFGISGPR